MASLEDLKTSLSGIKGDLSALSSTTTEINTAVDNVLTALQALKDQIANGANITQADLDTVVAEAQAADAAGEEIKSSLEAAKGKLTGV